MPAFASLYGGQITLSTQLIKPNYPINKHFGEFLQPLFNSTWDIAAVIIQQLVIIFTT